MRKREISRRHFSSFSTPFSFHQEREVPYNGFLNEQGMKSLKEDYQESSSVQTRQSNSLVNASKGTFPKGVSGYSGGEEPYRRGWFRGTQLRPDAARQSPCLTPSRFSTRSVSDLAFVLFVSQERRDKTKTEATELENVKSEEVIQKITSRIIHSLW